MTPAKPEDANSSKAKRLRSPAYPAINLESAITRAKTFYNQERRNAASLAVVVAHWGFKAKSSGGLTTTAALKAFGLIRDLESTSPSGRMVQLTDLALRILLDEREPSPERDTAVKQAALAPKIHQQLWTKWGTQLPSDSELRHRLIFDWKFNENSVADFVQEYRDTIKFAKLTDSDTISVSSEDKEEEEEGADMPEVQQSNQPTRPPMMPSPAPSTTAPTKGKDSVALLSQALVVSIPRNFRVEINVRGDELRREDLDKIKSQFNRWIEGLEEAFEN